MAPGEIRLSTTTMRRMPVLAQSQDPSQSQSSNDGLQEITVTAQAIGKPVGPGYIIAYSYNTYAMFGWQGVQLQLLFAGKPNGLNWVQTKSINGGPPTQDCPAGSCPFYYSSSDLAKMSDSSSLQFYDSPGLPAGSSGTWSGQLSLVQQLAGGGYTTLYTWSYGFQVSGGTTTPSPLLWGVTP
jgi:hypothetical protein